MPSNIDICNQALSMIGARATIAAFDEGSANARQCAIWYDRLRRILLRAAPWGFARGQGPLSQLGSLAEGTSQFPWPFMYSYPPDMIKLRYIVCAPQLSADVGGVAVGQPLAYYPGPSRDNRFMIGSALLETVRQRVVLTTVPNALAVYTAEVSDTALFDDLFIDALANALAFRLVIPLAGNVQMRAQFKQDANDAIMAARAVDGNEANPTTNHTPDWITGRGFQPYGSDLNGLGMAGQWYSAWDNVNWAE